MKIFLATPASHTKIFTEINPRYCLETFFELKRKKKDSDIIKYMQYKNKQASFLLDYDEITNTKPPAYIIIDDRCICFDGNTQNLLQQIENFKPWHYK